MAIGVVIAVELLPRRLISRVCNAHCERGRNVDADADAESSAAPLEDADGVGALRGDDALEA